MIETSDDRELLHSFVGTKDERAFAKIVGRHEGMMRAVAGRVCGDPDDAKDAMQRALVAFVRRAREIRAEPSVGPWLHRATTLEALAIRRQRIKRSIREKQAMEYQQPGTPSMPAEIAAELDEAINRLPAKDRTAIVLHFLEKHTYQAIARKHGGSEAAWQKRGVRALEKLSATLRRRGVVATVAALGSWLAATPAEAAASAGSFKAMLGEAMATATATSSSSAIYLIMKLKATLALCFVGGAVISYGWNGWTTPADRGADEGMTRLSLSPRAERPDRQAPGFSLERMAVAIRQFDAMEEATPYAESRLRALMFSVPPEHLEAVFRLLAEVAHPDRFGQITACLYGRWAELDPEAAWLAAMGEETYGRAARRGVLLTWLNTDAEAALAGLMDHRTKEDIAILREFVMGVVQHAPRQAAAILDMLAEFWPEADRRLFEEVAKAWAFQEPDPAGEWVASYWDKEYRDILLKRFAWRVARNDADAGLRMADRIGDPMLRQNSRWGAMHWAGIAGGINAIPTAPGEKLDGFPSYWGLSEIHGFAVGTMQNHWNQLPQLVALAKTEDQRQQIYRGAIVGSAYSQPSAATLAVENISPDFLADEAAAKSLQAFIVRWTQMDPAAATSWLEQQPADAKTELMHDALRDHVSE